jgi:hypothetical protein
MKTLFALSVCVPIGMVVVISHTAPIPVATSEPVAPVVPVTEIEQAPAFIPAPVPSPVQEEAKHLHDYVLGVMRSWPKGAKDLPVANTDDIASDITNAVLVEPASVELATGKSCYTVSKTSNKCFWHPAWNTDGAKAVLMAAIAYYEGSRFAAYVDTNRCTDRAWRKTGKHEMLEGGDCDGGAAHSLWQIHPFELSGSKLFPICSKPNVDATRFGAARCALELARQSMVNREDLSTYTGESAYLHPKADERLEWARKALKEHPYGSYGPGK